MQHISEILEKIKAEIEKPEPEDRRHCNICGAMVLMDPQHYGEHCPICWEVRGRAVPL